MERTKFKFKSHPGDFLRSDNITPLPDPNSDPDTFLLWFLSNFQSDDRVAYIDDLYKLLNDEIEEEIEHLDFKVENQGKSKSEIQEEINQMAEILKREAYENFYQLILDQKIQVMEPKAPDSKLEMIQF